MLLKKDTLTLSLIISLIILNYLNISKKATIASILIIFFVLILEYLNISSNENKDKFSNSKLESLFENKYLILLIFFVGVLITQNVYLNYEVITWDVPSYLVASQEINAGYLPLETQWESKGPLFLYLYNFISNLVGNSYIYFRLANDFILLAITFILFNIVNKKTNSNLFSTFVSLFFISITSKVWYVSEYSELYSLFFISIAHLIHLKIGGKYSYLFVGFFLGLSTLVNQGTVLFLFPFIISYLFKKTNFINSVSLLISGFSLPHIIFLILYFQRGILDIYISNYIHLPLAYTKSSLSSIYELKVWIRGFYDFNSFLYAGLALIIVFFVIESLNAKSFRIKISNPEVMGFLFSIILYFIAGHNYYHHLFYFLFFSSLLITQIFESSHIKTILILIFISFSTIFFQSTTPAFNNLRNLNDTQANYPLYQLAIEIDKTISNDIDKEILALDYVLLLYYLEKPNYSYVVHPSNHFDPIVIETLENLNKINENHISSMIEEEPKVIVCNPRQIINGNPQRVDTYNCAIADYKFNYMKLDTLKYQNNENLEFYKNPYQTLDVYIRKD
tara:strand:- start:2175 stop:3866 length:1692 start_codon:yes stop_codon:yes gene_type:complete